MSQQPIVVTGFGVLACNGLGRRAYWDALEEGRSGIRAIERFDPSPYPCQIAGELPDFDPHDFMGRAAVKRWHRTVHMAVASARMAVEDADLDSAKYDPERMSSAFGTSVGEPDNYYLKYRKQFEDGGWRKITKLASSATSGHASTVNVSVELGLKGPAATIATGCATGVDVISWGLGKLREGKVDAVIAGATECPITEMTLAATCSLGIASKRNDDPAAAMRPFDRESDGIVLSEGAGAVVLERADKALARGAKIYAEVAGYGSATEAHNALILKKEGETLSRAITLALDDAGMKPADLDAAQSHGVSLPMYDRSETLSYKMALGDHAYRIPISAAKSMTGQPYSVGGMFGVGAALLSLEESVIAPNINLEDPDPHCDLDYVSGAARLNDVNSSLVTALSFGGTHSAVVLRKMN